MKKNKQNIFIKKIKSKRVVTFTLAVLATGATATAVTVITQENNVSSNITRNLNQVSSSINTATSIQNDAAMSSGALSGNSLTLNNAEMLQVKDLLSPIQQMINYLVSDEHMTMQESGGIFAQIKDKTVAYDPANINFASEVGLTGKATESFLAWLNSYLNHPATVTHGGHRLGGGLRFVYSRTGLLSTGFSDAYIKVAYVSGEDYIFSDFNPSIFTIAVTLPASANPQNVPLQADEVYQIQEQLGEIQAMLDFVATLNGTKLTETSGAFAEVKDKTVGYAVSKSVLASEVGITGIAADNFYTWLESFLVDHAPATSRGHRLIDGLNFAYSRESLLHNGSSAAHVRVEYVNGATVVTPDTAISTFNIDVIGLDRGDGRVTALEAAYLTRQLNIIQVAINKLQGLSFTASGESSVLSPISSEQVVLVTDAKEAFVNDLGFNDNTYANFSASISKVLANHLSEFASSHSLSEGVSFVYTRSGLSASGFAEATISVRYDAGNGDQIVPTVKPKKVKIASSQTLSRTNGALSSRDAVKMVAQLNKIQTLLNGLQGLSLFMQGIHSFSPVDKRSASYRDAMELFVRDLGISTQTATDLFAKIALILNEAESSPTDSGDSYALINRLSFAYTRTSLAGNGTSHVTIRAYYDLGDGKALDAGIAPTQIGLSVTGIANESTDHITNADLPLINALLEKVQTLMNDFSGLSLTVNQPAGGIASLSGVLRLKEIRNFFSTKLGIQGEVATSFFAQLHQILSEKAAYTPSGIALGDGLIFNYTRTSENHDGSSLVTIRVGYDAGHARGIIYSPIRSINHIVQVSGIDSTDPQILSESEKNRFVWQLDRIQDLLNSLSSQELSILNINGNAFRILNREEFVDFRNAASVFPAELGITGQIAVDLFAKINAILNEAASHTSRGINITDGLSFAYIRDLGNGDPQGKALGFKISVRYNHLQDHLSSTHKPANIRVRVIEGIGNQEGSFTDAEMSLFISQLDKIQSALNSLRGLSLIIPDSGLVWVENVPVDFKDITTVFPIQLGIMGQTADDLFAKINSILSEAVSQTASGVKLADGLSFTYSRSADFSITRPAQMTIRVRYRLSSGKYIVSSLPPASLDLPVVGHRIYSDNAFLNFNEFVLFTSQLDKIQSALNSLVRLSLVTDNVQGLTGISETRIDFRNARAAFISYLGMSEQAANDLFAKINAILGESASRAASGFNLIDKLSFVYTRSGLTQSGTAHVTIRAICNSDGNDHFIFNIHEPASLDLSVTLIPWRGDGRLSQTDLGQFFAQLDKIQTLINNLQGLRLTVDNQAALLTAISEDTVNFKAARSLFATKLGISGQVATDFFTNLQTILGESASHTAAGVNLVDGLSFVYTRTGLTRSGTAHVTIRAIYDLGRNEHIVSVTHEPASLDLSVTIIPRRGDGRLSQNDLSQFFAQLDKIQTLINGLQGLALTVDNQAALLNTISEATVDFAAARPLFATELGISGQVATDFFTNLQTILGESASHTAAGVNLVDGLSFIYTRTGLTQSGTAHVTIRAIYDLGRNDHVASVIHEPASLDLSVTIVPHHDDGLPIQTEINQFTAQLDKIQTLINGLQGLRLTVDNQATLLNAISEATVDFAAARPLFATELGISGQIATDFFTKLQAILDESASHTVAGVNLVDGLSFIYTRTGLVHNGVASATLMVRYISSAHRLTTGLNPVTLNIDVTGITPQVIEENKDELRSAVNAELKRIADLHLSGSVTTELPAVNGQVVTSLTAFGITNLTLNNDRFIYQISHVRINESGPYSILLVVLDKTDHSIISDPATILITATITHSTNGVGTHGDGSIGDKKLWYIIGGTVGGLGLVTTVPLIIRGVKGLQSRFTSQTAETLDFRVGERIATDRERDLALRLFPRNHGMPQVVEVENPAYVFLDETHFGSGLGTPGTELSFATDEFSEYGSTTGGELQGPEQLVTDEAGILARQDQIGRPQVGQLGQAFEGDVPGSTGVRTLGGDIVTETPMTSISGVMSKPIYTAGADYYESLAIRLAERGTTNPTEFLDSVYQLKQLNILAQQHGLAGFEGFTDLSPELQQRALNFFELAPETGFVSPEVTAGIIRGLSGEFATLSAEIIAEMQGLSLSSSEIIGALTGRVVNLAEVGGLEVVEGLAMLEVGFEAAAVEDGFLSLAEHLFFP